MVQATGVLFLVFIVFVAGCTTPSDHSFPVERQEEPHQGQSQEQSGEHHAGISPVWSDLTGCETRDASFHVSPLPIEHITHVEPQGELTGIESGHITPGDHVGFQYDSSAPGIELRAPADGYIVRVERQPESSFFPDTENFHVYVEYTCEFFSSFVHMTAFSDAVLADETLSAFLAQPRPTNTEHVNVRIPIQAGHVIGEVEGFGLLGMLTVDTRVTLPGFAIPEHYADEPWKTHAVAPFGYFPDEIRDQLLEKNPRTKEPRGGKIDFDVDGTLAGNWFLEGSGYYRGDSDQQFCGDYYCPYWDGHLAFVADFVDPDQPRISIGFDTGIQAQNPYGVKEGPDFVDVGPETGVVTYELMRLEDYGPEMGVVSEGKSLFTRNSDDVVGVLLVEMASDRTLQMEVFPGAGADEVTGFTDQARRYTR